jgi:hypothetical protein
MKTIIFFLAITLMFLAGCKKCYTCYSLQGRFNFYKGIDSILVTTSSGIATRDSITAYNNAGYSCDTLLLKYVFGGAYNTVRCPEGVYEKAMANLDSCIAEN